MSLAIAYLELQGLSSYSIGIAMNAIEPKVMLITMQVEKMTES